MLAALRDRDQSLATAETAVRWRDRGVVGFDLAGPEEGFPVADHVEACRVARDGGIGVTLHAGEGFGPESIRQALELGGAQRLGHGVRIVEDLGEHGAGPVARRVIDDRVPLEVCPTSNVHTGIVDRFERHPIEQLRRSGFAVTLNTDNRLMSGVLPSSELAACIDAFGWGLVDVAALQHTALDAAFVDAATASAVRERLDAAYGTPDGSSP